MAFTPLIKELNPSGTTFYTFSSAARDLSKTLGNESKEFRFSHFVCLNIPDFICASEREPGNQTTTRGESALDIRNLTDLDLVGYTEQTLADIDDGQSESEGKTARELARMIQNYMLNFEECLLCDTDNDNEPSDRSVAERVFFKWLKETGAISFIDGESEKSQYATGKRFIEGYEVYEDDNEEFENAQGFTYNKVVRYIGDIDVTNNVDIASEAYTEIYLYVPSNVGSTQTVLFKQDTNNFKTQYAEKYTNTPTYILGQNETSSKSAHVECSAIYDYIDESGKHYYDVNDETDSSSSSYTGVDGICIDFDPSSYKDIVENPSISTILEYNGISPENFEFNAVLVYYDIVDNSAHTTTSNLYGILFLDNVREGASWDYIPRYPKYVRVGDLKNGNSWGIKLNLRIDVEPNKNGITTLVNEYNTYSLSLYSDAITKLQVCIDAFTSQQQRYNELRETLSDLQTLMFSIHDQRDIIRRIESLETALENANIAFASESTLVDLISRMNDDINSILSGRLNTRLQYNTDVIQSGYNVTVDNSVQNRVVINSATASYNISQPYQIHTDNTNYTITPNSRLKIGTTETDNIVISHLQQSTNMVRVCTEDAHADEDIIIRIADNYTQWKNGQCVRVSFPDLTRDNLNGKNIIFETDYYNRSGSGTYGIIIQIDNYKISDYPLFEVICMDSTLSSEHAIVVDILK